MAGSSFGNIFKITTWGESHGPALGVVVDGVPAGIEIDEDYIQSFLDRRKPGNSKFATKRAEADKVEILSGIFEGRTTGTPISLMIRNTSARSKDYSDIASYYRPGHADYGFSTKYGFRDYRGGGRSSGRETAARVAAGAIAIKLLSELGISVNAYAAQIGPVEIDRQSFDLNESLSNKVCMPDKLAADKASAFLEECIEKSDSAGGMIECVIKGVFPGLGDTVFEKLDANLAKAIMSVGAVKCVEIGDGIKAASLLGSENNDSFIADTSAYNKISKSTNHSGGILGGMSDGSDIILRAAIKPTPSIAQNQKTVNADGEEIEISIHGRHDPIIVPRAVVVIEAMSALVIADALLMNMTARLDRIKEFYKK